MRKTLFLIFCLLALLPFTSCKSNIGYSQITYVDKDGNEKTLSIQPGGGEEYISEVLYAIDNTRPKDYDYFIVANIYCSLTATKTNNDLEEEKISYRFTALDKLYYTYENHLLHSFSYNTNAHKYINSTNPEEITYTTTMFYAYPDETYLYQNNEKTKTQLSDEILNTNSFYSTGADKIFNNLSKENIKDHNIYVSDTTKSSFVLHYELNNDDQTIYYNLTIEAKTGLMTNIYIVYNNYAKEKYDKFFNDSSTIKDVKITKSNIQLKITYNDVPNNELSEDKKAEYK